MALGLYARSYYTINPVRVYRLAMQHLCNSPAVQEVSAASPGKASLYKRPMQGRFEQAAHWLISELYFALRNICCIPPCTVQRLDLTRVTWAAAWMHTFPSFTT